MNSGECLCGSIRFEFGSNPRDVSFCHCTICRRLTGSAFAAYFEVSNDDLNLNTGAKLLTIYAVTDKLTTRFCQQCGSKLFTTHSDYPGFTYVSLGAIPDSTNVVPEYHQYVASKARWHEIADSLPQYDKAAEFE